MKPRSTFLWGSGIVLALVFMLFLLPLAASPTRVGALLRYLPFGWLHFLQRNLPQMTYGWPLIATGLICSLVVILLAGLFLRLVIGQTGPASDSGQTVRSQPWRWAVCIYAGIWLLFIIAFGSAGVLRHTTWLMQYQQPWYRERTGLYHALLLADTQIQTLILDNDFNLEPTRNAFKSERSFYHRQTLLCDEMDAIFYGDTNNKVAAYVIIPRNRQPTAKDKFVASIPGTDDHFRPIQELEKTIAKLDLVYPQKQAP